MTDTEAWFRKSFQLALNSLSKVRDIAKRRDGDIDLRSILDNFQRDYDRLKLQAPPSLRTPALWDRFRKQNGLAEITDFKDDNDGHLEREEVKLIGQRRLEG